MSSFCTAKANHIFFSKKFQHICISPDVNFNQSLTKDVFIFEQLGPVRFFVITSLAVYINQSLHIYDKRVDFKFDIVTFHLVFPSCIIFMAYLPSLVSCLTRGVDF